VIVQRATSYSKIGTLKLMKGLALLLFCGALGFAGDVQVFLFARTDCPAMNRYAPELRRIAEEFQGRHVAFYLVYPEPQENKRAIENHMAEFRLPGTPLRDPDHELQKRSHATMTPEAAVFDSAGNLKYHGRTDDLEDAVSAVIAGKPVTRAETNPIGCSLADFNHDIAPIIYKHCAACHRSGEAAPFSLLTYEDVKKRAKQIAEVTRRRYMPPWLPDKGDFSDEQHLSNEEIEAIASWAASGAPEGEGSVTPPKFTEGWQLGPPDLIVEAPHSYTLRASGPDVYWNFILSPDVKTTRYVRAIEIRPGVTKVVHHANLYVDRARSAEEGEGMDPVIERTAFDPDDGHFLFWKPGLIPKEEAFSWQLDPGNNLVLNVHMQPSGKAETIRPVVGLYFTDEKPQKFPLLIQLEHDGALNIAPGVRDFAISDDFKLPRDANVLAVYPHAHYLGHVLEAYATLPSGERKPIIRIPNWDPNWQSVYRFREPLFLPKDTVISMRYHYDNSAANVRNPNHPPKRVKAGNQATDEMGHLWLEILPVGAGDRRLEFEQAILLHRLQKYPNDFPALLHLGTVMLSRLNPGGALPMLQAAVKSDPKSAEAHNFLGSALSSLGRTGEATEQFRLALSLKTDYSNARFNLGNALVKAGKFDDAIAEYRRILEANPEDELTKDRLEKALAGRKGSP
jgi:mono/diheme cytochrome c family protein